jgi:hypothetical protein
VPQPPQFFASAWVLTHEPSLQVVNGALQAHLPLTQF